MKYCYLDALITKYWITPEQGLFLTVVLDPKWNPDGPHMVHVGWSEVVESEEVKQYLDTHQPGVNDLLPGWVLQNISWKNSHYYMLSLKGIGTVGFACEDTTEATVSSSPVDF
ncbi:MAG: hypothetical protein AAFQ98_24790 [Bacteroidota bacterium]